MEHVREYAELLTDVKERIRSAQARAALSANAEMLMMYWDIGRMIQARQDREGWGVKVIPRLATDLNNDFPEQKGFSARNRKRMIRFQREYSQLPIVPQPAAQLRLQIPWMHHVVLWEKVKDLTARAWYMEQVIAHGWP